MDAPTVDPRWKDLYKLAGIAAIVSEFVILLGLVTFFIWPYAPGSKTTEEILRLTKSSSRPAHQAQGSNAPPVRPRLRSPH